MKLFLLTSLLLTSPLLTSAASVLAIDYGTDGFKASLIKPGVPFDVLINKDSKRKTPSIVTLRGEERSFGGEAANLATRFPKDTFQSIKLLLGHPSTHSQSQLFSSLYPNPISTTQRNSPSISSSTESFPIEEVLAMQFTYAKEMAEEVGGEVVRDTVVTVPAWFGFGERAAVLDAMELAGLRSIGLVNDGTAAAVNYAMSRTFPPTLSYHLFYDFGAGSLRCTLVSLKSSMLPDPLSLAAKPELKNVTTLAVHGVGFDTGVGGLVFDRILRDLLVEDFEEINKGKGGKGVKGDARAMAKLLKEAGRVKNVLSANVESVSRIEGLIDDTDFKTTVSRKQLEQRASDLSPRFIKPIFDALKDANLTLKDIESVIMVGGSSRVPMVEAAVRSVVGEERIAKNVNADEAAVMGAALYGAAITKGFRTKDIRVQDITPYGIEVSYQADNVTEEEEPRIVTTQLFPALSKTGVKKTMTFKKSADFAIQFNYRKDGSHSDVDQPTSLFETTITGLTDAFTNFTSEVIGNATVKVTIELDASNVIHVSRAVVMLPPLPKNVTLNANGTEVVEEGDTKGFNDRFKNYFGKFKTSKAAEEKAAAAKASSASASAASESAKASASAGKKSASKSASSSASSSSASASSSSSSASAKKEKVTTKPDPKKKVVPEPEPELETEEDINSNHQVEEESVEEEENPFLANENDTEEERKARIEALLKAALEDTPTSPPVVAAPVVVSANSRAVRLSVKNLAVERAPMSLDEKMDARKRLREVKLAETKKLAKAEARNVLESYIYRARDLVAEPEFVKASNESERSTITSMTEAANEWLWDEADNASTKELKAKKTALEKLIKLVSNRVSEAAQRPQVLKAFAGLLSYTESFLKSAHANNTAYISAKIPPKYTEPELELIKNLSSSAAEWFESTKLLQAKLSADKDVVFKVADAERKAKELETEINKLLRKKAPRKPKIATPRKSTASVKPSASVGEEGEGGEEESSSTTIVVEGEEETSSPSSKSKASGKSNGRKKNGNGKSAKGTTMTIPGKGSKATASASASNSKVARGGKKGEEEVKKEKSTIVLPKSKSTSTITTTTTSTSTSKVAKVTPDVEKKEEVIVEEPITEVVEDEEEEEVERIKDEL